MITITRATANPFYWRAIAAPYNAEFVAALRALDKGRTPDVWLQWDRDNKLWMFLDSEDHRAQILALLGKHFPNNPVVFK